MENRTFQELKSIEVQHPIISNRGSFKHFIHLLGLRYADGCIYYQKRSKSYTFYICFGDKIDAIKFAKDTNRIFSMSLNVSKGRGAYYVYLPASFSRLLISLGSPVGNKTDGTFRLPQWVFSLPPKLKWEFLGGLFSGDGSIPRLKPYGSSLESLSISLSAKVSNVEQFCAGFMTDLWVLISELGIQATKPTIRWNTPRIAKNNKVTYPVVIRVLTQKKNMLRFLENISYAYCDRAFRKAAKALKVLKGSRQNAIFSRFVINRGTSPNLSVLLEPKFQEALVLNAAGTLSNRRGKFKRLAEYLNTECFTLRRIKCSSIQDVYLPDWRYGRKFIPIDCFMELIKLSGGDFFMLQDKILKVKYLKSHNGYAVPFVKIIQIQKVKE